VNTPERAREHFATLGDPVSLVYDVIPAQCAAQKRRGSGSCGYVCVGITPSCCMKLS
jgi:hypothetical protein